MIYHLDENDNLVLGRREGKLAPQEPIYYRFVFGATEGNVALARGDDFQQRFQDLIEDVNDHDYLAGYVYPIQGGYRLTDREHKPLTDRFVAKKVIENLSQGAMLSTSDNLEVQE